MRLFSSGVNDGLGKKKGEKREGGRIEKRKSKMEKEEGSGGHVRQKKQNKKKDQGKHFFKFSIANY